MQPVNFCQSCSMPLENPEMQGTEKDGTKSKEYCKYCYQNGTFINPGMTLEEMKTVVISQMEQRNIGTGIINMAVTSLPHLKQWSGQQ